MASSAPGLFDVFRKAVEEIQKRQMDPKSAPKPPPRKAGGPMPTPRQMGGTKRRRSMGPPGWEPVNGNECRHDRQRQVRDMEQQRRRQFDTRRGQSRYGQRNRTVDTQNRKVLEQYIQHYNKERAELEKQFEAHMARLSQEFEYKLAQMTQRHEARLNQLVKRANRGTQITRSSVPGWRT